jgi:hypothetical protein
MTFANLYSYSDTLESEFWFYFVVNEHPFLREAQ